MIAYTCPQCGKELSLKDEYAGRIGKCKWCKELIRVPDPKTDPPTPEPTVAEPIKRKPDLVFPTKEEIAAQPQPQVVYMQSPRFNTLRLAILLISLVGMAGTFLPWVTVPIIGSISGLGKDGMGDGLFSLIAFGLCAVLAIIGDRNLAMGLIIKIAIAGLSVACIWLFATKYITFIRLMDDGSDNIFKRTAQIGIGLYSLAVAGAANLLALLALRDQ